MDLTGIALIVAAAATLTTAITTALIQLITILRVKQIDEKVKQVDDKVSEVKHLVNSASEAATAYNLVLSDTLRNAGQEVPVDPSVTPPTSSPKSSPTTTHADVSLSAAHLLDCPIGCPGTYPECPKA